MKKRLIIVLKIVAWVPLVLCSMLAFVPVWVLTGRSTLDMFEEFDNNIFERNYDNTLHGFFIPPPPKVDKDYPDFNTNDYPETPVDKPKMM